MSNRADRANQIAANLRAQGLRSVARDCASYHLVFVDDGLTGAACGSVTVFDSGATLVTVTCYAERVAAAIAS